MRAERKAKASGVDEELDRGKAAKVLQDLRDQCKELVQCYESASLATERSDVKAQFLELSAERKDFADHLHREATRLAAKKDLPESPASLLSSGLTNVQTMLGLADARAVISKCEKEEQDALKKYTSAIRKLKGDSELSEMLDKQKARIQIACDSLLRLRESFPS